MQRVSPALLLPGYQAPVRAWRQKAAGEARTQVPLACSLYGAFSSSLSVSQAAQRAFATSPTDIVFSGSVLSASSFAFVSCEQAVRSAGQV